MVRLPLIDGRVAPRDADDAPERTSAPLEGKRILIVDDDRDAADSLCRLLAAHGAETKAVYDGPAAIDALNGTLPHVVVLDIGMPGMDGYALACRIRPDARAKGVTLVALGGWGRKAGCQGARARHRSSPDRAGDLDGLLDILNAP